MILQFIKMGMTMIAIKPIFPETKDNTFVNTPSFPVYHVTLPMKLDYCTKYGSDE